MITQERLKEVLDYDADTGQWTWIKTLANRAEKGSLAGYINNVGYRMITIQGKSYQSSRLAFLYQNGKIPDKYVDHIDGNRSNDRWNNLREATPTQNQFNRSIQKNNTSGAKGVGWDKRKNRWVAKIWINRKCVYSEHFISKNDAIIARKNAEVIYHGEYRKS